MVQESGLAAAKLDSLQMCMALHEVDTMSTGISFSKCFDTFSHHSLGVAKSLGLFFHYKQLAWRHVIEMFLWAGRMKRVFT